MDIDNPQFEPQNQSSVIKPWLMSHGTMQSYDLRASRRFYEEFLGLECVRQGKPAIFIRCGMKWHIVVVQAGSHVKPAHVHQHWGLEVKSREEVDAAFAKANEMKDTYGIGKIHNPSLQHGVYSFYFEDLDHNWWEILYYDGFQHDDAFDFGDRFPMDEDVQTVTPEGVG